MFSFNFFDTNVSEEETTMVPDGHECNIPAEEYLPSCGVSWSDLKGEVVKGFDDLPFPLLKVPSLPKKGSELEKISSFTDIIPGKYEGGLKVWESSLDLIKYLAAHHSTNTHEVKGKVLEAGCGHGLPGIVAMKLGYSVTFTDLNKDVLESVTAPNVYLNSLNKGDDTTTTALPPRYISGDWKSVADFLHGSKYHMILSAETLYTSSVMSSLHDLLENTLEAQEGAHALVAAKRFYFGAGLRGGTREFQEMVRLWWTFYSHGEGLRDAIQVSITTLSHYYRS